MLEKYVYVFLSVETVEAAVGRAWSIWASYVSRLLGVTRCPELRGSQADMVVPFCFADAALPLPSGAS